MSAGTPAYGLFDTGDGTSTSAGYPTGSVGDKILFVVGSGETSDTLPACSNPNFALAADVAGGSGSYANNAGIRHLTIFQWTADSTLSGTVAATIGGSSANRAIASYCIRIPKGALDVWDISYATANKSTASTNLSVATSPQLNFTTGDVAIFLGVTAYDVPTWSAESLTTPGVTYSAFTERVESETSSGFDVKMVAADATVTAGTATGATTATASFSTSTAGVIVVRLHAAPVTSGITVAPTGIGSGEAFGTPSVSTTSAVIPTSISSGEAFGTPSVSVVNGANPSMLMVLDDKTALATDTSANWMYSHWSSSYNITLWNAADAAPVTLDDDYDIVVITNSCSSSMSMTGYDTSTLPVLATGVRSPHSGYAQVVPTNGPTQTTQYVKNQGIGDPVVPTDITVAQDVQVVDTAFNQRYVLNVSYGSGRHEIACTDSANLPHLTMTRYDVGDQMWSGTAPSKRAWIMVHSGSLTGGSARGWEFIDNAASWMAPAGAPSGITAAPSSIATAEQFGTTAVSSVVSATPTGVATAEQFGTPSALPQIAVSPTGVVTQEQFGTPATSAQVAAVPTSIDSEEVFGVPGASSQVFVSPSGISSAEAMGTPSALSQSSIVPDGIPSSETFGVASALTQVAVIASSITSAEQFGTPSAVAILDILPTGIASVENFGAVDILSVLSVIPNGIASFEAFGLPNAGVGTVVVPTSIASAEAFGLPSVGSYLIVSPTGISSGEVFGAVAINPTTGAITFYIWDGSVEQPATVSYWNGTAEVAIADFEFA